MHIAIIGCGVMGSQLAQRLHPKQTLSLFDSNEFKIKALSETLGLSFTPKSLADAVSDADLVILAVKPQNLDEITKELKGVLTPDQILISILAGIPLSRLRKNFDNHSILRAMPNLPLAYGEGVVGITETKDATLKAELTAVFKECGLVYWLPEEQFDGLTALTGSGPAFILTCIEAMIDAGIALGFPAPDSRKLVLQTVKGSVALLDKADKHPGDIKWQITSPGGTTIAGLIALEEAGVRSGVIRSFLAAYERTKEFAKE